MKRNNEPNEVILLDAVRAIIALDTVRDAIGAEEFDSLNSTPGVVCLLGGNISFTLDQSADVTICYNLASRAITILAEGVDRFGKFEVEYYSICGSSAIFGEEFLTDAYREKIDEFKMIEENGIYTKKYT